MRCGECRLGQAEKRRKGRPETEFRCGLTGRYAAQHRDCAVPDDDLLEAAEHCLAEVRRRAATTRSIDRALNELKAEVTR